MNPLLFQEAIEFFKNKIQLPTASWTDIWQEQHSHAFVVAGAAKDALIADFYNALKKAQTEGTGYAAFRDAFDEIVARHGWSHNGAAGWRSKVIYQTNITQAYNAGRYKQMQAVKHLRPYWRYVHTSVEHPRLQHLAWDGLVLSADDPWWDTHMPQNGWHCKCRVDSLSRFEAEEEWKKSGKNGPDTAPPIEWEERVVGKTGAHPRTVLTPKGIDAGFAHNPGKSWLEPHTVPPLTGFDVRLKERNVPFVKDADVLGAPDTSKVSQRLLVPATTPPKEAIAGFLDTFGATFEKGAVFEDAAGHHIAITKALFVAGLDKSGDNFKWLANPDKAHRLQYINLLAMTLIEPDEIWWHWERARDSDQWLLKRRYLRAFEIEGKTEFGIVVFEWGKDGWAGSTAFLPDRANPKNKEAYFNKQRVGRLIYAKKKK